MRRDDPRLAELASDAQRHDHVVGFVERSDDEQLYIAAALLEDGGVKYVYRKSYLPNYGLFDERRFFGAGTQLRAVDSSLGVRLGLCICEDFWHLPVPYLLALDGAQILINISSSPGRDVAATDENGLGTATSWRTLMRAYAQLTTSYVVFVNRVGVEEAVTFWGGSQVIDPAGDVSAKRHSSTKGCTSSISIWTMSVASGRHCHCCATSGRSSWRANLNG